MGIMIEQKRARDVNEIEKKTDSTDHLLVIKVLRVETLITSEKKKRGKSHQFILPFKQLCIVSYNRSALMQTHYLMSQK